MQIRWPEIFLTSESRSAPKTRWGYLFEFSTRPSLAHFQGVGYFFTDHPVHGIHGVQKIMIIFVIGKKSTFMYI